MTDNLFNLCSKCNHPKTGYFWCKYCYSRYLQSNFDKWTSGNKHVDDFIQETQLEARNHNECLAWIPYNRLRNIQYISRGGFATIYKAIWLDGRIIFYYDNEEVRDRLQLKDVDYENAKLEGVKLPLNENENEGKYVVLKRFNNSSNIHKEFFDEVSILIYANF